MGGGLLMLSHLLFQKVTDQASSITSPVKDCYIFNILIILKCPITVNIFLSIRNGDCQSLRQSPNNCVAEAKATGEIYPNRTTCPTLIVSSSVLLTTLFGFFTYRVTKPSYMKQLVISFYTEPTKNCAEQEYGFEP